MRHLLTALTILAALAGCADTDTPTDAGVDDDVTAQDDTADAGDEPAEDPADDEPAEPVEPEPEGFGDGTYEIGPDLKPGTYRSTGSGMCYWARVRNFSGDMDAIIANGNNAPEIVTVLRRDGGFESRGCGDWLELEETAPAKPVAKFGDGTYRVGMHIRPGTYRSDGEDMCYWARLTDFTHEMQSIKANGNNSGIVEIGPGDEGFTAFGCGEWRRR